MCIHCLVVNLVAVRSHCQNMMVKPFMLWWYHNLHNAPKVLFVGYWNEIKYKSMYLCVGWPVKLLCFIVDQLFIYQQVEVLNESKSMIPDCSRRLVNAHSELSALLVCINALIFLCFYAYVKPITTWQNKYFMNVLMRRCPELQLENFVCISLLI